MSKNIYSGELGLAKILTTFYPYDILTHLEKTVSSESPDRSSSWDDRLRGFSAEQAMESVSLSRFETLLNQWSPYDQDKDQRYRFLFDATRLKTVYRILYMDAVYLRFNVLLNRWAVNEIAKKYVDSFVMADKDHPLLLFMQGEYLLETGDSKSALTNFSRIINHQDAHGRLTYEAFNMINEPLEKMRLLPQAAEQLDGRPELRFRMGWLFQKDIHDYDLAFKYYLSGLEENPFRFWVYQEMSWLRGSAEPLLKALEQFPGNYKALEQLGSYYAQKTDAESRAKALNFMEKAQKLAPSKKSINRERVRLLLKLNRDKEAFNTLVEWTERYGKNDILLFSALKAWQAKILLKMGDPQSALKCVQKGVDQAKADVMIVTARAYEDSKKVKSAADKFQEAFQRYPTAIFVLSEKAAFHWRQGEYDQAAALIKIGRPQEGPFSRWYFDNFIEAFQKADDDQILKAVQALESNGATSWEIGALGHRLKEEGRLKLVYNLFNNIKISSNINSIEQKVDIYVFLKKWKGKEYAKQYLKENIPTNQRVFLPMIFYKDGLSEEILEEIQDPESLPAQGREFAWLQKLIAWLTLDKQPAGISALFASHYQTESTDYYHAVGKYMLEKLPREDLLKLMESPKQRCEFNYYIGLSERLKGNFTEATYWYHMCLETLLQNNGEFHWAADELFWWAHMGLDRRHRKLKDDIDMYHKEHDNELELQD